tara:strand:- start:16970 stop:17449 length:480 start_codon:yes stop_codon:yes gene_type:complete
MILTELHWRIDLNINMEGVEIHPVKRFDDERGAVLKYASEESPFFEGISEVYFSTLFENVVKGWRKHLKTTQHFCVPVGKVKLVIYDDREESDTYRKSTEVLIGGKEDYHVVVIPPRCFYSFKGLESGPNLVANYIDYVYNHEETVSLDLVNDQIDYKW